MEAEDGIFNRQLDKLLSKSIDVMIEFEVESYKSRKRGDLAQFSDFLGKP